MIRPMGEFKVTQRTKDGFFNATDLLKQWNNAGLGNQKEMKHYFENKSTGEFIKALISEEDLHGKNSAYVKSKASRGENAGTWMHPLLFIDFAMWLNPSFKVKVLKFVYGEMIKFAILPVMHILECVQRFTLFFQRAYSNRRLGIWQNHLILLFMVNMNQKCVIKLVMRLRYVSYTS